MRDGFREGRLAQIRQFLDAGQKPVFVRDVRRSSGGLFEILVTFSDTFQGAQTGFVK